ncbi:MAG TPA: tetratricopeptide repeat protein [Pseudolabrys sp.]|nr:tetratricopeptide repeat protein [Pseudolabrys sp.]
MAGKIFINYRRDDSIGVAGRLYDRLAQSFGRDELFMDVDHIPAGVDFVAHLNSQVAACNIILVVIGPRWLEAKDENGGRRLDNQDDFVTIEIATALARNIRVIPVLVDGARMPKAGELPDPLKPLARRQAVEVRQLHFGRDAEALLERVNEALDSEFGWQRPRRLRAAVGMAVITVLVLIGWSSYALFRHTLERNVQQAELKWEQERKAAEAEANRKAEQAEQQRLAALKAEEEERQAKVAADAEAKRKADEAERQRLAAVKAEQERQARAAAEAEAKRKAEEAGKAFEQGFAAFNAHDYDRAIYDYNEAIRLDPNNARAIFYRGAAYGNKDDLDRAIADFNEAIRLDPNHARAFYNRGLAYGKKGDNARAIADYDESIRLDPKYALAFNNRGFVYSKKGEYARAITDYDEAIRLDPNNALAFVNRGIAYGRKGDTDRAIADFNEAIRLDPKNSSAFNDRGLGYAKKGDYNRAIANFDEAIRLNPKSALTFCNRGNAKLKIKNNAGARVDIAKAQELDASVCRPL